MFKELSKDEATDLTYRVSTADGDVGADNPIEIVAWLFDCPEYVNYSPEEALAKRIECCCILAENAQENIADYLQSAGAGTTRKKIPTL